MANRFYTVDGGGQQTYSGTVTISTQGDHTVTYWSVDNAGNTETANTTHIKLDNVAPANSLALTNKTGGSFVGGSTVYYRGAAVGSFSIQNTVSDATSGAASSTFPALGGTATGWTHTTPDVKTTPSGGPYVSNLFSWTAGTNSSPTEAVTGADAAGNTTTAPSLTFTNDSTAPATTDNTASIGTACKNTTQTVTLTPTDSASGAATTYYTTNGTTPTTSSSQGTSIALSAEGTYTIKYFTVDNVGNQETVKTAATVICIDKTAPAPTNVVLANGNGTAGTADNRDTLAITYSEQLDATTFCSTWTNTGNQTLTGASIVAQITDTGSNDTLDDHCRRGGELRWHGELPPRLDHARRQLRRCHTDIQRSTVAARPGTRLHTRSGQIRHSWRRDREHRHRRRDAHLHPVLVPRGHRGQYDHDEPVQPTGRLALLNPHPT